VREERGVAGESEEEGVFWGVEDDGLGPRYTWEVKWRVL